MVKLKEKKLHRQKQTHSNPATLQAKSLDTTSELSVFSFVLMTESQFIECIKTTKKKQTHMEYCLKKRMSNNKCVLN